MNARLPSFIVGALLLAIRVVAAEPGTSAKPATLDNAIRQVQADLTTTKSSLTKTRETIAEKRIALSREVQLLTNTVRDTREQWEEERSADDASDVRLQTLREEVRHLEAEISATQALLVEMRRGGEAQLPFSEQLRLRPAWTPVDNALDNTNFPAEAAGKVLSFLLEQTENAMHVRRHPATAIDPSGVEVQGTLLQVGHVTALFAADTPDGACGQLRVEPGSALAHITPVSTADGNAIRDALRGNSAHLPLDLTNGAAIRAKAASWSFTETLMAGGVVMIPLLLMGAFCLLAGLLKAWQLLRISPNFATPVTAFLGHLQIKNYEAAQALASATPSPLQRIFTEALAYPDAHRSEMEEILHETILLEMPPLERGLSILSIGAAVAPLLGLLGTVTGMIQTFRLIAVFGTGDPRLLSGGISEALVTTETGLAIAIPVLLLHAFLSRRVRAIAEGLETSALHLVNTLHARNTTDPNIEENA